MSPASMERLCFEKACSAQFLTRKQPPYAAVSRGGSLHVEHDRNAGKVKNGEHTKSYILYSKDSKRIITAKESASGKVTMYDYSVYLP